jgi:glycosyltransferase involved in cell wall biosynthesis
MRIFQLTPGTGHFYCGSCLRDDALARGLRALGHDVRMVALYLPFRLEDHAREAEGPVRMGGINMYLQQKLSLARLAPRWMEDLLDRPGLLRWASTRAGMTEPWDLGAMAVSMLSGELGRQAHEIDKLVDWLRTEERPDVLLLSNVLLAGLARRLREELGAPVAATLQGEAPFLDGLPEPHRDRAWRILGERARELDRFVPVSHWYGEHLRQRLDLDPARIRVVHNGIDTADFASLERRPPKRPTIGYLARLCADKGVELLVEAFLCLARRGRVPGARLRLAGVLLDEDRPLLARLEERLASAGLREAVEVLPNLERAEKLELLAGLTLFSVPATYGESFGLYLLEAMAAGIPVVQPASAAFPELLEATGGGVLVPPEDPEALAIAIESLLLDPARAEELGRRGRAAVLERFSLERMARGVAEALA